MPTAAAVARALSVLTGGAMSVAITRAGHKRGMMAASIQAAQGAGRLKNRSSRDSALNTVRNDKPPGVWSSWFYWMFEVGWMLSGIPVQPVEPIHQ